MPILGIPRKSTLTATAGRDIFLLRFEAEQPQGIAELYRWQAGQMERERKRI